MADQRLARDGHRIEHEGKEVPDLEADLVGRQVRGADARDDRSGEHEHGSQRGGSQQQVAADAQQRTHARGMGPQADVELARGARQSSDVHGRACRLRHDGRQRGGADAVAEPEDQHRLQHHVPERGRARHDQRCTEVLDAAQPPGAGHRGEERRQAEQADPQVDEAVRQDRAVGAEGAEQRLGEGQPEQADTHGEPERQPQRLDGLVGGGHLVASAAQPGDGRSRAVGQEDEDRVEREQHGGCHRQPAQLVGADVADDGGVGQHVERLGDERAEGRHRQPCDVPVVRAHPAGAHRPRLRARPDTPRFCVRSTALSEGERTQNNQGWP